MQTVSVNKTERIQFFAKLETWKPVSKGKVLSYFGSVDLRNNHGGLALLAKKRGINLHNLEPGEFVLFVNNSRTAVKMAAPNNVIAHFKVPGNGHLDLRCLSLLPSFFNGNTIDYKGALKETIEKDFHRKYH